MERLGAGNEIFTFTFAKNLKERVQELQKEYGFKPWEVRRMTLADIRRMLGPVSMPSRKLKTSGRLV